MTELEEAVSHQAEMQSLWLAQPTITEWLLMAALRHLHALVEKQPKIAEQAKQQYWYADMEL